MLLFLTTMLVLVAGTMPAHAGITPHKHEKHTSKERVKDGIYNARDTHHSDSNGEHNVEFDHEAIIGEKHFFCLFVCLY